jgi:hypothetical protein
MSLDCENTVRPEYDPHSEAYRVYYDTDSTWNVSTTLVLSLRSLTGDEHGQTVPLNRAVDPDVLECHVRGRDRGARLSFEFHGYHVTVRDDGRIEFTSPDEPET